MEECGKCHKVGRDGLVGLVSNLKSLEVLMEKQALLGEGGKLCKVRILGSLGCVEVKFLARCLVWLDTIKTVLPVYEEKCKK